MTVFRKMRQILEVLDPRIAEVGSQLFLQRCGQTSRPIQFGLQCPSGFDQDLLGPTRLEEAGRLSASE